MSRAYKIKVKRSEIRNIKADDEISTKLEILEVLPPEDMATLLKEELKKRGFEEQEDGEMIRKQGDVTIKVDPCSGEISVVSEAKKLVEEKAEKEATGYDDVGSQSDLRKQTAEKLDEELSKKFKKEQEALQEQVSAELEKELQKIQPEVDEIVSQVTRDALKQKAHKLGTVTEVSEDAESGSMTIKIEV